MEMRPRALQILILSGFTICCQWGEYSINEELMRKEVYHSGIIKQKYKRLSNENLTNFINEMSGHVSHSVFKVDHESKTHSHITNNDSTKRVFDWFENSSFKKNDRKWQLIYPHNDKNE